MKLQSSRILGSSSTFQMYQLYPCKLNLDTPSTVFKNLRDIWSLPCGLKKVHTRLQIFSNCINSQKYIWYLVHFGRYIQYSLTTSSLYFQDPHNRIFAGEEMQIRYDDRDDRDLEIQMSRLGFTLKSNHPTVGCPNAKLELYVTIVLPLHCVQVRPLVTDIMLLTAVFNSCVNPIIYGANFYKDLKTLGRQRRNSAHPREWVNTRR